jgi:hypothetical protein
MQFSLLPLVHSQHGSISSVAVWQSTVYVGTSTGMLLRFVIDLYDERQDSWDASNHTGSGIDTDSLLASLVQPPDSSVATRSSSETLASTQAHTAVVGGGAARHSSSSQLSPFAVVRTTFAGQLDARKHHGKGRGDLFVSLAPCPAAGMLCALSNGRLGLYDLHTLAFIARLAPPGSSSGGVDCMALFPAVSSSPESAAFQKAFSVVSLCLCAGKRVFIFVRNADPATEGSNGTGGAGGHAVGSQGSTSGSAPPSSSSSSSSLSSMVGNLSNSFLGGSSSSGKFVSVAGWSLKQELFLPEHASRVVWVDAVHILVAFKREYSIINLVTTDSVDLCSMESGGGGGSASANGTGGGGGVTSGSIGTGSGSGSSGGGNNSGNSEFHSVVHHMGVSRSDEGTLLNIGHKALLHTRAHGSHLLTDALHYHGSPSSLGSCAGGFFALAMDNSYLHVFAKPRNGRSSASSPTSPNSPIWRAVQNIAVVDASVLWSDGGSLVLLAKGPQLYFLQPIRAADKQRDALWLWSTKSKYLGPPPGAPAGASPPGGHAAHQRWSREEALKHLTTHVQSALQGATHPFALLIKGFADLFAKQVRDMLAAAAAAAAATPVPISVGAGAVPASPSLSSSSAVVSSSSAAPAASLSLPLPPSARSSARRPRTTSHQSLRPTLSQEERLSLVSLVRDCQAMAELDMRVMWADACSLPRVVQQQHTPQHQPTPAPQTPLAGRRHSLLSPSPPPQSATTPAVTPPAAEPPPQHFLPECVSLFEDALFRALSATLSPLYRAATALEDAQLLEQASMHVEQHATPDTFGSSICRKSPWIAAQAQKRAQSNSVTAAAAPPLSASTPPRPTRTVSEMQDPLSILASGSTSTSSRDCSPSRTGGSASEAVTPSSSSVRSAPSSPAPVALQSAILHPLSNSNNADPLRNRNSGGSSKPQPQHLVATDIDPLRPPPRTPATSMSEREHNNNSGTDAAGTVTPVKPAVPPSALLLSTLAQDCYRPSIQLLKMLPLPPSPASKLRLLSKLHMQLLSDSQQLFDPSGAKPFTMSADDLVPILCFVLIHAVGPRSLARVHAEALFLSDYLDEEQALGEAGYVLTTLHVALAQLCTRRNDRAGSLGVPSSTGPFAGGSVTGTPLFGAMSAHHSPALFASPAFGSLALGSTAASSLFVNTAKINTSSHSSLFSTLAGPMGPAGGAAGSANTSGGFFPGTPSSPFSLAPLDARATAGSNSPRRARAGSMLLESSASSLAASPLAPFPSPLGAAARFPPRQEDDEEQDEEAEDDEEEDEDGADSLAFASVLRFNRNYFPRSAGEGGGGGEPVEMEPMGTRHSIAQLFATAAHEAGGGPGSSPSLSPTCSSPLRQVAGKLFTDSSPDASSPALQRTLSENAPSTTLGGRAAALAPGLMPRSASGIGSALFASPSSSPKASRGAASAAAFGAESGGLPRGASLMFDLPTAGTTTDTAFSAVEEDASANGGSNSNRRASMGMAATTTVPPRPFSASPSFASPSTAATSDSSVSSPSSHALASISAVYPVANASGQRRLSSTPGPMSVAGSGGGNGSSSGSASGILTPSSSRLFSTNAALRAVMVAGRGGK